MRRKLAAGGLAVSPAADEVVDAWPVDDDPVVEDPSPIARLCIACGAEGCREHDEIARLDAPSRDVREAIDRLRGAAAEHRAAARALRVLVLTQVARGQGDLETKPAPRIEPCPRCTIRDAEAAAPAARRKAKRESGQQALPFNDGGDPHTPAQG